MKTKTLLAAVALLATATAASPLMAAQDILRNVRVTRTLLHQGNNYGGCMAALSVLPSTLIGSCGWGWVSLGCKDASGQDSVTGYRMLDQVQMAYALRKFVDVTFTDAPRVNGYCTVVRIDVHD